MKRILFLVFLIGLLISPVHAYVGDGMGDHKAKKDIDNDNHRINNVSTMTINDIQMLSTDGLNIYRSTGEFAITVLNNGYVGIGTKNPVAKLQIQDGNFYVINTNAFFPFGDALTAGNYGFIRWNSTNDYLEIGADDDVSPIRDVCIQSDNYGKVGIGTTTPEYILDVNGVIRSTGIISTGDIDATDYRVIASSFAIAGSGIKAIFSYVPDEYAVRVSTNFNIAGNQLTFGDGLRQLGCDGDDICISNGNTGGNISFDVSAVSTTVKIKDVLNLNPISAPPIDNMPQGSMYFDSDINLVYLATSSVNSTAGVGWINLLTQVTVEQSHAEIFIDTAAETTITQDVYTAVLGDYADGMMHNFTFVGATLTFTGTSTEKFDYNVAHCITAPSATEAHWKLAINGIPIDKTKQCSDMPNNDMRGVPMTGIVELNPNDKIAVYTTTNNGENLTHDTLVFKLVEIK